MTQIPSEKELLELLDKSEEEQAVGLEVMGIRQFGENMCCLAERLWESDSRGLNSSENGGSGDMNNGLRKLAQSILAIGMFVIVIIAYDKGYNGTAFFCFIIGACSAIDVI